MYTKVTRSPLHAVALLGAVALVACGDDDGSASTSQDLTGTTCTLGETATPGHEAFAGCPASGSGCHTAGGTVMRVCHPPGATPTAPSATGAAGATGGGTGVWSKCCCQEPGKPLYCAPDNGGAGGGASMCAGGAPNGILEVGEECDMGNLGGKICPSGQGMLSCTASCTLDMTACAAGGGGAATGG